MIAHPIAPVYDENSKILILGSFPSVKSREQMFFYGHPQNRFWQVTAAVFGNNVPHTVDEKRRFLSENKIALWDVVQSCEITGSSDSTIKNVTPNNLLPILKCADIEKIFVNGKTAQRLYDKYTKPIVNRNAEVLPSTSPANAAWNIEKLVNAWSVINLEGTAL